MMRYLVTGGAGFIGSHLADALVARGEAVTILDDLSTGRRENIDHLQGSAGFVRGTILDAPLVDELVAEADIVVHLAAAVGVKLIVDRPLECFLTNIRGTEITLAAAHRYGRKILITSTSEVYGKSREGRPFRENDDRVLGGTQVSRWSYATSKAADEILAFAYHRERGLPTILVRLFNCVGPRQTGAYGMVLPRLVQQALAGEPLTVHGDGLQTRCFCHVRDVVEALGRLLDLPGAVGDVFNVGATEEVRIRELAERVRRVTGSPSEIRFVSYDDAYGEGYEDMRRRVPDISKIRAATGWRPRTSLEEIIAEVAASMRPADHPAPAPLPLAGARSRGPEWMG
jgi:nucleoside-diphosphate-sugar epimerase